MLVGFTFENYASFYDKTEFAMTASANDKRYKGLNTFETEHGELLKNCIMYGANGSGKTNFISALSFMRDVVTSDIDTQSKKISEVNRFSFNRASANKPVSFSCTFIIADTLYEYGFSVMNGKVMSEHLNRRLRRTTKVFERSGSNYATIQTYTDDLKNVQHVIQNTRDDVLFLSWANFCNNQIAMDICNWFDEIQIFDAGDEGLLRATVEYIQSSDAAKDDVISFMQRAGVSIDDFELEFVQPESNEAFFSVVKKAYKEKFKNLLRLVDLKIKQKVYDEQWKEYETMEFGFSKESAGTRKLFEIAGPIAYALKNGGVVLVDEMDARLHPTLVRHLIMMFNSISSNPKNAQLICNTHDVTLLDEDIRRDQIYFVEKNRYGVSELYSLCDFKGLRKDSKILKQYLLGAFGALPDICDLKNH